MNKILLLVLSCISSLAFADDSSVLSEVELEHMINAMVLDEFPSALTADYTIYKNLSTGAPYYSSDPKLSYLDFSWGSASDYGVYNTTYVVDPATRRAESNALVWTGTSTLWNNMDYYQDMKSQTYTQTVKEVSSTVTHQGYIFASASDLIVSTQTTIKVDGESTAITTTETDKEFSVGGNEISVPPGCIVHVTDSLFNTHETGEYIISGALADKAYEYIDLYTNENNLYAVISGGAYIYDIASKGSIPISNGYSISADPTTKKVYFNGRGNYDAVTSSTYSVSISATKADNQGHDTGVICEGAYIYPNQLSSSKRLMLKETKASASGKGYVAYTGTLAPTHTSKPKYGTISKKQ